MSMRGLALSCTALWSAVSCKNDPTIVGTDVCEPDVSLTVSVTAPPEFTWQPDCSVGSLYVTTAEGNFAWLISSDAQADFTPTNNIESGVVYGEVPAGAHQFTDLAPLQPGGMYRLILSITDSHGDLTQVGLGAFTAVAE